MKGRALIPVPGKTSSRFPDLLTGEQLPAVWRHTHCKGCPLPQRQVGGCFPPPDPPWTVTGLIGCLSASPPPDLFLGSAPAGDNDPFSRPHFGRWRVSSLGFSGIPGPPPAFAVIGVSFFTSFRALQRYAGLFTRLPKHI